MALERLIFSLGGYHRHVMQMAKGVLLLLVAAPVSPGAVHLKVGFSNIPPLSYLRPDGTAAGFAVEVLDEAARREGVTLTWQHMAAGPSSEEVLRQKQVDMLPSLYDTPAHREEFYISSPWWTPEWSILVQEGSSILDEHMLQRRRLMIAGPEAVVPLFRTRFPRSRITGDEAPGAVLTALCKHDVDAAAFIRLELNRVLLLHLDACSSVRLREIPTAIPTGLSLAARPEAREYAKRLRARIDEMTMDGTLAQIAERHPPIPASIAMLAARNLKHVYERRVLTAACIGMSLLLSVTGFFLLRQRRVALTLRDSQARLARAHAMARLGNWEIEAGPAGTDAWEGRYYWSDEVYGIFGLAKDTFTPTRATFLGCLPADDRERVVAALERAAVAEKSCEIEHRVLQRGWHLPPCTRAGRVGSGRLR